MGGYTNVLNLYLRKLFIYYVNNTLCVIQRKPTRKQAHLVFADTQSQHRKTKRACFVANARTKKNEI